jgi:hypothetical protein
MAGSQRLLAIATAFLLTGIPGIGKTDALGMVVLADQARLGSEAATEGTTIYDGDRLSTGAGGSLRLKVGEAIVNLTEQSCVIVHEDPSRAAKEFEAELVSGAVVLSETAGTAAEIVASSARIRSIAETRGVVQVRLVGPHELIVFTQLGPAQISYRGETVTIAEGKSYRVLLNSSDDSTSAAQVPKKPGKGGKGIVLIVVGALTGTGVVLLWGGGGSGKPVESPDRP